MVDDDSLGRGWTLRVEQTSVCLMKNILTNFSKGGELMMDQCEGSLRTANAFLMLLKPWLFKEWEIDGGCFSTSVPAFVSTLQDSLQLSNIT